MLPTTPTKVLASRYEVHIGIQKGQVHYLYHQAILCFVCVCTHMHVCVSGSPRECLGGFRVPMKILTHVEYWVNTRMRE